MNLIATCTALPTPKVVHWETLRGFILIKPGELHAIYISLGRSRTVCACMVPDITLVNWLIILPLQQKSYNYYSFAHNIGIPVYPSQP